MRDAVIVGGGHNGLVCAAYLARAGLDVEVVERRDLLGGAAVTEEPWPGYRVSSASYVVSLIPPEIERELDLGSHGYRVSIITPDYFVPFPDGTQLTLWGDTERDAREVARLSPADAEAYAEFDAHFDRVAALLKELMFVVPPNLTAGDLPRWLALAARMRRWSGRNVAEIVRLFTLSAADFLDEWFTDERVKGALATQALVGNWGGPMTPGSAYVLMHHWVGEVGGHAGAWGWVHGGMGGVTRALASAASAAGASIRTDSPVKRVMIRDGSATGVELEGGETIAARRVISNAHPATTYLELVGEQHLPDDVVRDIRRFRTRSGSVKVNVALSAIPDARAWPRDAGADFRRGLVAVAPSIEYLERAWDDAKYGRPAERPYVEAVFPTVHEPELAPEGRQLMLAFVQYAPYRLAEETWDDAREPFGSRVLDVVDEHLPGLADAAEQVEVLAPPDLERRFGLVGGNIMQGEMTPDQSFSLRPIFGYADYTTPVRSLYLCGAGTHPGGGVMGVPGRNCARVVARAARRERRAAPLARLRRRR